MSTTEKTKEKENTDIVVLGFWTEFKHTYQWKYRETMELLSNFGLKNGVRFINSSVYQYNQKKGHFNEWGTFDWEKWVHLKKVKPKKVLYKSNKVNHLTNHIQEEFEFFNDLKLVLLANNKFDTAMYFKRFSPMTLRLIDIAKRGFNMNRLKKEEYVIKPINWSWWAWIMKVRKTELKETLDKFWYWRENVIIQEFLDMSCWVPGIVEWMHDIRFSVFGKKIFPHVYIRKPKDGDFRSNISAWWTDFFVPLKSIPKECHNMVKNIVREIWTTMQESIYSIDMVNTLDWYKLMELNSSPWFLFNEKDIQKEFFKHIIETLK